MRTAGFPCRVTDCDRAFQVADQRSMAALTEASQARSDHEVSDHNYRHVTIANESSRIWAQGMGRTTRVRK